MGLSAEACGFNCHSPEKSGFGCDIATVMVPVRARTAIKLQPRIRSAALRVAVLEAGMAPPARPPAYGLGVCVADTDRRTERRLNAVEAPHLADPDVPA